MTDEEEPRHVDLKHGIGNPEILERLVEIGGSYRQKDLGVDAPLPEPPWSKLGRSGTMRPR
jgi:hypothetical protein